MPSTSRRNFLTVSTAATAAFTAGLAHRASPAAEGTAAHRFQLLGFSKPFQHLGPDATADLVADVGWDGIECPVRARGQILPERVEDDLPRMVEALKKRNLDLSIISTDIKNVSQPLTEKVLRTASKLGIQRYRLAFWKYDTAQPIAAQLNTIRAELRDLAALNQQLGLTAGFQNHSGADYVGAPVWDIHELIKDLDPKLVGICFDIGHATLEGGYSWPIEARLMEPHFTAVFLKDFHWKREGKAWRAAWCPLGEGMVNPAFFKRLKASAFRGPISQHHEYEMGTGLEMIKALKNDVRVLKDWLATRE